MSDHDEIASLHEKLLIQADSCVKCGLCLPHCPTFMLTGKEEESPRGRISLIEGLASGALSGEDASLQDALQGCLHCQACSTACPAKVPYQSLITVTKQKLLPPLHLPFGSRLLSHRLGRASLWLAVRLGQLFGLHAYHQGLSFLRQSKLPRLSNPNRLDKSAPMLTLWIGCFNDLAMTHTRQAAQLLLSKLGYRVHLDSMCCGAYLAHAGHDKPAQHLTRQWQKTKPKTPLTVALHSGCQPYLQTQGTVLTDIQALLLRESSALRFKTTSWRIGVYTPCSATHLKTDLPKSTHTLLALIPGVTLIELNPTQSCCGAAGWQSIDNPERANALLARSLPEQETVYGALDWVVANNATCLLHIKRYLKQYAYIGTPFFGHPVDCLASALENEVHN